MSKVEPSQNMTESKVKKLVVKHRANDEGAFEVCLPVGVMQENVPPAPVTPVIALH